MKNFRLDAIDSYLDCALHTAENEFDIQEYMDKEVRYALDDFADAYGYMNTVILLITLAREFFKEYCELVPGGYLTDCNSDK